MRPQEIILAETATLSPAQLAWRRGARGRLDFALPISLWHDNRYSVLPRSRPVSTRGGERWYTYMQVAKRAVNPRTRRRIIEVSGGSMSNIGSKPRR
jgi:hypothetical protein